MINIMKNINKNIVPATLAVLVVLSAFAPGFISVAGAATFNAGSQPYGTLRAHNLTDNGSCSTCWQDNEVGADVGDTVTFQVFINNTSDETADDVHVRLTTNILSDGRTAEVTARVSASNASQITDTVRVRVPSGFQITDLDHTGITYVRNILGGSVSLVGSPSDIVSSSGVNIGDVIADDANARFVYAHLEVNGNDTPDDDGVKPEVTTLSATDINGDEARLRGEVDPNGLDTEVWFEWGQGFFSLDNDTPKEDVGDGNSVDSFDAIIDNLDENETYHFRAVARNSEGTDYGLTRSFSTGEDNGNGPEVIDIDVDNIDEDSARLICEVDPNGEDTDVWFEWSDDEDDVDNGNGEETNSIEVDRSESSEEVRVTITGLDEDTEYFFKCLADNTDGDDESNIDNFTTDENGGSNGNEPDVTTRSATDVTTNSALLRGEADPNGEDTDVWFEWGTSASNLNRDTATEDIGDGTSNESFDARITGLSANTTYFFRAVGENNEGDDRGSILSFRTGTVAPATIITQIVERIVEREPEPEPEGLIITLDTDTSNIDSDEIRYTVSYDNRTDETFTDAELIVEIPNELEFVDADPNADDESGDNLFFTIGTISPGEEDSFVIDTEVANNVDENDEITFVANVEYTDDGIRKIVTVIDARTLAEARNGAGFGAFIGGAFADFFTNPLLWLVILLLVMFFVYRYFANLARPKQETVYVREPFGGQFPPDTSSHS